MTWSELEPQLRARWAELSAKKQEILRVSKPLREARDAIVQQSEAKIKQFDASIREAEAGLYDLDNELAHTARQLGAKSLRVR